MELMQKFTTQGARRAIPAGENACADAPRPTIMSAAYLDVRILWCSAMQSLFAFRLSYASMSQLVQRLKSNSKFFTLQPRTTSL